MRFSAAIIGTGYGLRVLSKCLFSINNINLNYIFSRNKKGINFTNNIHLINKDKKINLICIETPPFTHLKLIKFFIKKKAYILCEKPAVNNIHELNKLQKLIQKKTNKILINHQLRYHPYMKKYKKLITNKKIKKIKIEYYSNNFYEKKNTWWIKSKLGGGHLLAIAPHLLDLLNFYFGNIKTLNKKLGFTKVNFQNIDTSFTIYGEFSNGILFEVKSSCKTNLKKPILKISSETSKNLYLFNNYKNLKINRRVVNFKKIKFVDKFYSNPWRESQYFFLKDLKKIFNNKNLMKNLLKMSLKNLKLIF